MPLGRNHQRRVPISVASDLPLFHNVEFRKSRGSMSLTIWRRTTGQQATSCVALYGNTIGRERDQQLGRGPDLSAVAKFKQFKQFIDILMCNDTGAHGPQHHEWQSPDSCSIEWGMNHGAFNKCTTAEVAKSQSTRLAKSQSTRLRERHHECVGRAGNCFSIVYCSHSAQPACPASGVPKAPNALRPWPTRARTRSKHRYQDYYNKRLSPHQFKQGFKFVEIGAEKWSRDLFAAHLGTKMGSRKHCLQLSKLQRQDVPSPRLQKPIGCAWTTAEFPTSLKIRHFSVDRRTPRGITFLYKNSGDHGPRLLNNPISHSNFIIYPDPHKPLNALKVIEGSGLGLACSLTVNPLQCMVGASLSLKPVPQSLSLN